MAVDPPAIAVCRPVTLKTYTSLSLLVVTGLETLAGQAVELHLIADAGATSLEFGIFDGDTGLTSGPNNASHWDLNALGTLNYELFADPNGSGIGMTSVATFADTAMLDNDWFSVTLDGSSHPAGWAAAETASGARFFRLVVTTPSTSVTFASMFKVRADGYVTLPAAALCLPGGHVRDRGRQHGLPELPGGDADDL